MWSIWFRSEISFWKRFRDCLKIFNISSLISIVLRNLHGTDLILHSTEGTPTVLMLSPNVLNTFHKTEAIPHCTDLIPTVLNNLHSTEGIPQCWSYQPTCTAVIPHSTEGIRPQYWIPSIVLMYPPQYWCYPPDVLLLFPTVLKLYPTVLKLSPKVLMLSPRCTEQPPIYWTASTVLNWRYMGWNLNLPWWIWICRGEFEFAVVNFKFAVVNLNLPWRIWICRGEL